MYAHYDMVTDMANVSTWNQAVELARKTAQETVRMVLYQADICATEQLRKCLLLAVAQKILAYSVNHYDMSKMTVIQIRSDEPIETVSARIAEKAIDLIASRADNEPEVVNMAVIETAAKIVLSIESVDLTETKMSRMAAALISIHEESAMKQKRLVLMLSIHMLGSSIWRSGWASKAKKQIRNEVLFDWQIGDIITRISNEAIASFTINNRDQASISAAITATAALLARSVSPACEPATV
jgi:hypothetical protein